MKFKNLELGMKVKLRKDITKCTYTDEHGYTNTDCDIRQYKGGDVVVVDDTQCFDEGMVWVKKEDAIEIKIHPQNLRKIK